MKFSAKYFILIGLMLFIIATIWGAYWALALQRDGCLVTEKIVAHTKTKNENNAKTTILVHRVITYNENREGKIREDESTFEANSITAPQVGTVIHYYIFSSPIEYSYDVYISSDWHYAWLSPALSLVGVFTCAVSLWIIKKYRHISCYKLIITIIILAIAGNIYINPVKRTFEIRKYVLDQRKYRA